MGAVMGAFSVASVVGVPAGLYLAQFAGWRAPFFVVGGCGLAITASVIWLLPPIAGHLNAGSHRAPMRDLLVRRETWLGLAMTALLTLSAFLLIPNLSAFIQFNMGWPRNDLGLLYMVGGAMSFVALRIFGRITDHFGAVPLSLAGSLAFTLCTALWLIVTPPPVSVLVLFPAMMISMSARNVANQTLLSRVPLLAHRAAFQSLNSATQHFASALAAILGASLLTSLPSGALVGVDNLAWIALSFAAVLPLVVWRNDRVVGARDAPSAVSD
jgi:predicted MFS family arabinose efflux permease